MRRRPKYNDSEIQKMHGRYIEGCISKMYEKYIDNELRKIKMDKITGIIKTDFGGQIYTTITTDDENVTLCGYSCQHMIGDEQKCRLFSNGGYRRDERCLEIFGQTTERTKLNKYKSFQVCVNVDCKVGTCDECDFMIYKEYGAYQVELCGLFNQELSYSGILKGYVRLQKCKQAEELLKTL